MSVNNNSLAGIIQIPDLTPFENSLEGKGEDALVIFDLDNVVMMPHTDYSMSRNPYRKE